MSDLATKDESLTATTTGTSPSDESIEKALRTLLDADDASLVTVKDLRKRLESDFGVSLLARKSFIKSTIIRLMTEKATANSTPAVDEGATADDANNGGDDNVDDDGEMETGNDNGDDDDEDSGDDEEKEDAGDTDASLPKRRTAAEYDFSSSESDSADVKTKKKDKKGGGAQRYVSSALGAVLGTDRVKGHFEVTKLLWQYIKGNNLQNPSDKRYILCDEKMEAVFGRKKIYAFTMAKDIGRHLLHKVGDEQAIAEPVVEAMPDAEAPTRKKTATKKKKKATKKRVAQDADDENDDNEDDDDGMSEDGSPAKKKKRVFQVTAKTPWTSTQFRDAFGVERSDQFHAQKLFWEYVKKNSLQDRRSGQVINIDDNLIPVFECERVHMMSVPSYLKQHLLKDVDACQRIELVQPPNARDCDDALKGIKSKAAASAAKKKKKTAAGSAPAKRSGIQKPMLLSDALAAVCGAPVLPRTQVQKQIWKYIKEHDLQEPKDKRKVRLDAALSAVFPGRTTMTAFKMPAFFSQHMTALEEDDPLYVEFIAKEHREAIAAADEEEAAAAVVETSTDANIDTAKMESAATTTTEAKEEAKKVKSEEEGAPMETTVNDEPVSNAAVDVAATPMDTTT